MENILLVSFVFLLAAVITVPISNRLGLGSVLGYLLAGIIIGPVLGLVRDEAQDIQHYAEDQHIYDSPLIAPLLFAFFL